MRAWKVVAAVGALVGVVVWAAPDVDPWEHITTQKRFMRPAAFEQSTQFAFIDAGTVTATTANATTANATTAKVDTIDAGAVLVNGTLQVGGGARLSSKNKGTCVLDGGSPAQCDGTGIDSTSSVCSCFTRGTTAASAYSLSGSLTSTTVTCTAANGKTDTVGYHCF